MLDVTCAELVDREQQSILIRSKDRDNFMKNMVTTLAEIRLGLAVTDVQAC